VERETHRERERERRPWKGREGPPSLPIVAYTTPTSDQLTRMRALCSRRSDGIIFCHRGRPGMTRGSLQCDKEGEEPTNTDVGGSGGHTGTSLAHGVWEIPTHCLPDGYGVFYSSFSFLLVLCSHLLSSWEGRYHFLYSHGICDGGSMGRGWSSEFTSVVKRRVTVFGHSPGGRCDGHGLLWYCGLLKAG
jgi:hypothetical protein